MSPTVTLELNWNHLRPQVEEMMIESQYSLEEIKEALQPEVWSVSAPFEKEKFWYEHAEFTLTELCNVVELLTGDDRTFCELLRLKLLETVDKLMEQEVAA